MGERGQPKVSAAEAAEDTDECSTKKERTGVFTSGIVSTREGQKIALFLSGHRLRRAGHQP